MLKIIGTKKTLQLTMLKDCGVRRKKKKNEEGERMKSRHGWSIFPRKYFDERPLSRVDFRTWDNSSYHNGGKLKERWKEGSRLFASSVIGFHVKRTNVSRLHFYIHISRPLDSFHCIKRYLPRCSPNYFRSLRHLIRHKISSFKDIEFK